MKNNLSLLITTVLLLISTNISSKAHKDATIYKIYSEKKVNNDKVTIQVLDDGKKKYWKIINTGCEKIVIGTKTSHFFEKSLDGPGMTSGARIIEGDTLIRGEVKLYPIDFFSKDPLYNKKSPNFVIQWSNFVSNNQNLGDYFAHFYDDVGIVDWF